MRPIILAIMYVFVVSHAQAQGLLPGEIDAIVKECKAIYRADATPAHSHPCPCPEDVKSNGDACADWSAYRKQRGS